MVPLKHSSMSMAIHTPFKPMVPARYADSGIRKPHMLTKFMILGTNVSPAPRNTPVATMLAPNSGSANTSMRSTAAPKV